MSEQPVFIQEIIKTSQDMWEKGWAEANGGNISLRLSSDKLNNAPDFTPGEWKKLLTRLPSLGSEIFLVSGTGKYLRNISVFPHKNVGLIELSEQGDSYRILWGFERDGRPTSELEAHLRSHAAVKDASNNIKHAVIHTHAPHLIALSYGLDLTTAGLTKLLWQSHAECVVGFPGGVEFIPWMMAGSDEIAAATAKALKRRPMALWQYHGIFGAGRNLDEAFGLIDMAEKAAYIYLTAMAATGIRGTLSDDQLGAIAVNFGVDPDLEAMAFDTSVYH